MALRFLQLADLHLGVRLNLPDAVAERVRSAVREVAAEAFESVTERGIELVLMPGDLFEQDGIDPTGQLRFVYDLASSVAPIPVVIAPGNHDPYGPSSPYAAVPRPANVHLFTSPELELVSTQATPVIGRAFTAAEKARQGRISWENATAGSGGFVLLLHGSLMRQGLIDERNSASHYTVLPLTTEALERSGCSYAALGHYHRHYVAQRQGGPLALAAYSGCPQGQGWDECGPKGYLVGALEAGGAHVEFIPAARCVWRRETLDLPPEYAADASQRLAALLERLERDTSPSDIVGLNVRGRWPDSNLPDLRQRLQYALRGALHMDAPQLSAVRPLPELADPQEHPVVAAFFEQCEIDSFGAAGEDVPAWELASYLGHCLLSGQDLPVEIAG